MTEALKSIEKNLKDGHDDIKYKQRREKDIINRLKQTDVIH